VSSAERQSVNGGGSVLARLCKGKENLALQKCLESVVDAHLRVNLKLMQLVRRSTMVVVLHCRLGKDGNSQRLWVGWVSKLGYGLQEVSGVDL
jgi:hypothetical protein